MDQVKENIQPCSRCGSKELLYPHCEQYETVKVTCNGCGKYYGHYTNDPSSKSARKKTGGDIEKEQRESTRNDWMF